MTVRPRLSALHPAAVGSRVKAAIANNPAIRASQLAEQAGCSLGVAIAALERRA